MQQVVDRVLALPEDARLTIAAPLRQGHGGGFEKELARLRKDGFVRVQIDGVLRDLGEEITLDAEAHAHSIEVQVDRVRVKGSCAAAHRRGHRARVQTERRLRAAFTPRTASTGWPRSVWSASDTGESYPRAHAAHLLVQQSGGRVSRRAVDSASRRSSSPSWWCPIERCR